MGGGAILKSTLPHPLHSRFIHGHASGDGTDRRSSKWHPPSVILDKTMSNLVSIPDGGGANQLKTGVSGLKLAEWPAYPLVRHLEGEGRQQLCRVGEALRWEVTPFYTTTPKKYLQER